MSPNACEVVESGELQLRKDQTRPESILHRIDSRNPSIKLLRNKLTDWPRGPLIILHNGTWKQAHRLTQKPSFFIQMELKSCYLETSSQTGPEASHKRTNVDMDLKQCYLEASSQAAPEALLFQLFRSQKPAWLLWCWPSWPELRVLVVVVVVLLSWWWC